MQTYCALFHPDIGLMYWLSARHPGTWRPTSSSSCIGCQPDIRGHDALRHHHVLAVSPTSGDMTPYVIIIMYWLSARHPGTWSSTSSSSCIGCQPDIRGHEALRHHHHVLAVSPTSGDMKLYVIIIMYWLSARHPGTLKLYVVIIMYWLSARHPGTWSSTSSSSCIGCQPDIRGHEALRHHHHVLAPCLLQTAWLRVGFTPRPWRLHTQTAWLRVGFTPRPCRLHTQTV